jgi:hypothetical protein
MAASADVRVITSDENVVQYPVAASTVIYDGTLVALNGSSYAAPLAVGKKFVGINVGGKVDNSAGAAGALSVQVRRRCMAELTVAGFTSREQHGAPVFASDDNTFTLTQGAPGATVFVGRIVEYKASGVAHVMIDADSDIDQGALGAVLPAQIDTAGDVVYTVAQILSGMIDRDTGGGARTDTTPAATALIAGRGKFARVGDNFFFVLKSAGGHTITLAHGSGVTIVGTATVATLNSKLFRYVQTGASTVSIYSIGTMVH